ncbi:MAG: DUF6198 family protein [Clostridium perfringens]|nr:DUF6198 family protein [Clostridium perfringens]
MKANYKRYVAFLLGLAALALGVALAVQSNLGASAYDSINFAVAGKLNLSVSMAISVSSIVLIIISSIVRRKRPRISTFITGLIMGLLIDFWVAIVGNINVDSLIMQIVVFVAALILMGVGIAAYVISKLPPSPLDDLLVAIDGATKISMGKIKIFIDVTCMVIAFVLGGPIGVGTILMALLLGPTINFFYKLMDKYNIVGNS